MITFEAVYDSPSDKPYIGKVISLGGEQYVQKMTYTAFSEEDMDAIPLSVLTQHFDNLLSYMKNVAAAMTVVGLSEPKPSNGEFITGLNNLWWAKDELRDWWSYARMTREPEDS